MVFPCPPKNEQESIASFIEGEVAKIDALLAEQQRLIELLDEKRLNLISHTVSKGLNASLPMKTSGFEWLREIPSHWDMVPIKRVAKIRYGIGEPPQYHDTGTPLIRATNVHGGKLFDEGMVFVNGSRRARGCVGGVTRTGGWQASDRDTAERDYAVAVQTLTTLKNNGEIEGTDVEMLDKVRAKLEAIRAGR